MLHWSPGACFLLGLTSCLNRGERPICTKMIIIFALNRFFKSSSLLSMNFHVRDSDQSNYNIFADSLSPYIPGSYYQKCC